MCLIPASGGTGSAVIKPDSDTAIAEMVKLLKGAPAMKAYVVGRTDNTGLIEANVKLWPIVHRRA